MHKPVPALHLVADTILHAIQKRVVDCRVAPLVAIDGGSGAGKSTLAEVVAARWNAALVPGDDFFAAGITDAEWDAMTPTERMDTAIDWRRLRTEALEPLLAGRPARWQALDFEAGERPDGTYAMRTDFTECLPADVILLDGAYSTRPELADLIGLSVLIDVPVAVRHERLATREDRDFLQRWHARWDAAEAHYFTHVRPASSFDIVIQ